MKKIDMKSFILSLISISLTMLIFGFCSQAISAFDGDDGFIIERKIYNFPTYKQAEIATDVENYASRQEYEKAVGDDRFELQKLKYKSDGLKVVAYLYKPKDVKAIKMPAIIFNRGSFVRGDIAPELVVFFHRLASEGFIILAPMYRQSDGGEGRDEMGGADVNDLMNIVPLAKSLEYVDINNLFLYGESRGGMMSYQAVKRGLPVRAAAVFGGFTDLEGLIASQPEIYKPEMIKQIWQDFDIRKDEIIKTRSAIHWADRLNAPLLIMHGGSDWSVNARQSLILAQQLQKLGKPYELIIYYQDDHILSHNRDERDRQAVRWFRKHFKN